jgi:hypothetical protein
MSNLLAGFGAVQSFLDRTKHRSATQLEWLNLLPAHRSSNPTCLGQDSNFNVMQADRLVRRSQHGRDDACGQETVRP